MIAIPKKLLIRFTPFTTVGMAHQRMMASIIIGITTLYPTGKIPPGIMREHLQEAMTLDMKKGRKRAGGFDVLRGKAVLERMTR